MSSGITIIAEIGKKQLKACVECDNEFESWASAKRKFCSQSCQITNRNKSKNPLGIKKCLNCGLEFGYRSGSKYCNVKCRRNAKRKRFAVKHRLRARMYGALKRLGIKKNSRTFELLGCQPSIAREWIEKKFKPGMTWQNIGDWHIDHIRPLASYDLNDEIDAAKAFHYTNLQPLWAKENLSKGSRHE